MMDPNQNRFTKSPKHNFEETSYAPENGNQVTFVHEVRGFGDSTTLHGMRFVTGGGIHFLRRILWVLFLLGFYIWLFIELHGSLHKFFQRPVVTIVSVNHVAEVTFPAVTLCNHNMIRADKAEKHRIFLELMEANVNEDAVIHWEDYDNATAEGYTWNLTQWALDDGHQIEDMLIECKWKVHEHCSPEDFLKIMTDFGLCYTFNWDEDNPLKVGHAGSSYGLTLRMRIEQDQYTFSAFGGAGLKLFIHPQGELPLVKMHGFSAAPGLETDVTLKYQIRKNLPHPYEPYCEEKPLKYSHVYNAELCRFECEVDIIIEKCGCKDYRHPGDAPPCDPKQQITCVHQVREAFSNLSALGCDCPESCDQETYDSQISIAQWPSNYFAQSIIDKYNTTKERIRENMLELNVYFEEVRVEEIVELPAYDGFSLVGNVGGYMGLLCGASLITVVEILDCLVMTCRRMLTSKMN